MKSLQLEPVSEESVGTWLSSYPAWKRLLGFLFFGALGLGALFLSHELVQFFKNWVAWLITISILEPVGLTLFLFAICLIIPKSSFAKWLVKSLPRARYAALIYIGAYVSLIAVLVIVTLVWGAIELYKST
jgi:hypothetical protein